MLQDGAEDDGDKENEPIADGDSQNEVKAKALSLAKSKPLALVVAVKAAAKQARLGSRLS